MPEEALSLKERGNSLFKEGKLEEAIAAWTEALQQTAEESAEDAALYSNRAAARLKLGQPDTALQDADAALRLRPGWDKAYFRRGCALEARGELQAAQQAYEAGLEACPTSRELRDRAQQLRQRLRQERKAAQSAERRQERKAAQSAERRQERKAAQSAERRQERRAARGAGFDAAAAMGGLDLGGAGDAAGDLPAPDAWARGLSAEQQREWIVDCYRMRVDDDYAWGGGNLHGLYDPDATEEDVAEDFLIFCKLAVLHGVVPSGWDWSAFLRTAVDALPHAFEKVDAKKKWGGENVFHSMLGGRSLRFTGGVVYGTNAMGGEDRTREERKVWRQVNGRLHALVEEGSTQGAELLREVGGQAPWRELLDTLSLADSRAGWV